MPPWCPLGSKQSKIYELSRVLGSADERGAGRSAGLRIDSHGHGHLQEAVHQVVVHLWEKHEEVPYIAAYRKQLAGELRSLQRHDQPKVTPEGDHSDVYPIGTMQVWLPQVPNWRPCQHSSPSLSIITLHIADQYCRLGSRSRRIVFKSLLPVRYLFLLHAAATLYIIFVQRVCLKSVVSFLMSAFSPSSSSGRKLQGFPKGITTSKAL